MSNELIRFGVSLDKKLLSKFDELISSEGYPSRSEAIRDLIRERFVKEEWEEGSVVAGTITLVFDHHQRDLQAKLTDISHDYHHQIISSQHIHLDHDNCLEIIVVKGNAKDIKELADKLKSTRGVKLGKLTIATTGEKLH